MRFRDLKLLPSPVPEADVKKIVAAYNAFTPTIIDTLTQIATKAPDFESIGVAPTIQNDLILSDASCKNFRILVEGMTPVSAFGCDVNWGSTQLRL